MPLEDLAGEPSDHGPRPSQLARESELGELVEKAMLALSEDDRWLIDCRDNLGMSYEEIAAELGGKPANAKLRRFRAKERLEARLEELGGGG